MTDTDGESEYTSSIKIPCFMGDAGDIIHSGWFDFEQPAP